MFKLIRNFKETESGAAMVEYAIALLVAAGVGVTVFSTMGDQAGLNASAACTAMKPTTGSVSTGSC